MDKNLHLVPTFFIIGERKCGTSSLFRYICNHPLVVPGKLKEPNFFINTRSYINSNIEKYWNNFPLKDQKSIELQWPELDNQGKLYQESISFDIQPSSLTGEASANTFVDVEPQLIKEYLPNCKLIILLRNPLERVISHYNMFERFVLEGRSIGFELLPFEQMMEKEMLEISQGKPSPILYPSLYIKSLPGWMETFGKDQIQIIKSYELKLNPSETMAIVYKYLELPPYNQVQYNWHNQAPILKISHDSLEKLKKFLSPYNESLFHYLGENNPWG